jgi:hypothetical protein
MKLKNKKRRKLLLMINNSKERKLKKKKLRKKERKMNHQVQAAVMKSHYQRKISKRLRILLQIKIKRLID